MGSIASLLSDNRIEVEIFDRHTQQPSGSQSLEDVFKVGAVVRKLTRLKLRFGDNSTL